MSSVDRHVRAAARIHDETANIHEEASRFWAERGDPERAERDRRRSVSSTSKPTLSANGHRKRDE
jgi:hypothetical protein